MAIISTGYAGTVNDQQWARMARYHGSGYCVRDRAALACTQVGTSKTFNIAAGEAYGYGVMDTNDADVVLSPTVPSSGGRWFLVIMRRNWSTKVSQLMVLGHSTTTATVPTAVPTSYPAMNNTPGTADDQPLFWVWVNATNTTTLVVDLRNLPLSTLKAGTAAERDAFYGTINPASVAGRRFLQATNPTWYNTVTNVQERYLAEYNASTNPTGATLAGWYPIGIGAAMRAWSNNPNQTWSTGERQMLRTSLGTFGGEDDPLGWLDPSTGRITPTLPGIYRVQVQYGVSGGTTNARMYVRKNGGGFTGGTIHSPGIDPNNASATVEVYLNGTTDYLELYGYHTTGSAKTITLGFVSVQHVGPVTVEPPL